MPLQRSTSTTAPYASCTRSRWRRTSTTRGSPMPREPVRRPEVLTPQELEAFFREVTRPKHFAFFLNLYGSGLRISEMAALRVDDIDARRMLLHVRCGKGRKERFAPLTQSRLGGVPLLLENVPAYQCQRLHFSRLFENADTKP